MAAARAPFVALGTVNLLLLTNRGLEQITSFIKTTEQSHDYVPSESSLPTYI